jgi:hypothetical protein
MSQSNSLRGKWVLEIKKISNLHLDLLDDVQFNEPITVSLLNREFEMPDLSKVYSKLNNKEKNLCRKLIKEFLQNILIQIDMQTSWRSLALILGNACYKKTDYSKQATENVNLKVSSFIRNFFLHLESSREYIFNNTIESASFWQDVDDIVVFENTSIINKTNRDISNKSPLQQIKYLSALKRILIAAERTEDPCLRIDFEQYKEGLVPHDPFVHRHSLFLWIEETYTKATAEIEFLSKTQIKILKNEIERISEVVKSINHNWSIYSWNVIADTNNGTASFGFHSSLLIKRFDEMILFKSRVRGGRENAALYFRGKENLSDGSSSAAVIRYLVYGLIGLNPDYMNSQELMRLKIWISTLFYDIQGFSYDDIRKALERKRELYN